MMGSLPLAPVFRRGGGALAALALALSPATGRGEAGEDLFFGGTKPSAGALMGIFYDLKQDQKQQPTDVKINGFSPIVAEFLEKGWDESVLNRYFRATRPLYTGQMWVPKMQANSAPRAFGVADLVRPTLWLVHYKGQVSAPRDGRYRFVGIADNTLCAAIDGETVLLSYIQGTEIRLPGWSNPDRSDAHTPFRREQAFNGKWFQAKKGQILDLDLLVGERPGGSFYAFLMIEREGESYPAGPGGGRLIPPFQLQRNRLQAQYPHAVIWTGHP